MRKISMLLFAVGIVIIGYSLFTIWDTKVREGKNLEEAKTLLEERGESPELPTVFPTDFAPGEGETIGVLQIPKMEAELPIIEGTHEDELAEGVGHYGGTAYPLQNDQIVLSGHRDTVFRGMGVLELGDVMTLQFPYGDFDYEIVETKVVGADDLTVIVPTAPDEVLTVTTCYPLNAIGGAPDRYIITALPVDRDKTAVEM